MLLVVVLVPGVGIYVSGSRRWLGAGCSRFQPSEIAKLALLLYAADLVEPAARASSHDWRRVVRPVLLVLGGFALLVMKEPDLGSAMVLGARRHRGARRRRRADAPPRGRRRARHRAVDAPRAGRALPPGPHAHVPATRSPTPANAGYQISQSLIALGSGGLTGVGLGAGRAKWNFLPNAHTDFIFAIIGEELGLIGCFLVIGLFIAFGVLGTRAALRAPDRFGMLLAAGVTVWVVGQAVINIGAVVGLLPVTGIPLPFVSFGGSALDHDHARPRASWSTSRGQGRREPRRRTPAATPRRPTARR